MSAEKKHPLDIAQFFVTLFALAAATFAAWFTYSQVSVARDMEQRQLRAYVGIDEMKFKTQAGFAIRNTVPQQDGGTPIEFTGSSFAPTIKNYGLTPARDVTINWDAAIQIPAGPIGPGFAFNDHSRQIDAGQVSRLTLHAGQSKTTDFLISKRNAALLHLAVTQNRTLLVFGYLTYTDIFGKHWRDNYCYVVDAPLTEEQDFIPCNRHNDEGEQVP